ncbi:MAG TPA: hypothetical protein VN653_14850 [Anaerolineales bacterium]|nr:hypothetical protein [Anaerolineales bacterium]
MPAEMKLKEETSSRIILESDPSSRKSMEYLRMLAVPPLLLAGLLIFMNFPTWLNWVIIVLAIVIETVLILFVSSELTDVNVVVDFVAQRATRTEKPFLRRPEKKEMDLNQVKRVLIHCEEQGHHCRMLLESMSSDTLELDFYLPTKDKEEAAFILSKKIGSLLRKPVALKVTDMGNLISEELLQA